MDGLVSWISSTPQGWSDHQPLGVASMCCEWKEQDIRMRVEVPVKGNPLLEEEYYILEVWSDGTVRHPTSGHRVLQEIFDLVRPEACHFLRTGEWRAR